MAKDLVMPAAETNVRARALLEDDKAQAAQAKAALAQARSADGIFVSLLVLAELSWVLRSRWDHEPLDGVVRIGRLGCSSSCMLLQRQKRRIAMKVEREKGTLATAHHLLEITIADPVLAVPTHCPKDDLAFEMTPFEI
jgi:hypothetical protein